NLTVNYSFAFNHEIVNDLLEGRYDIGIVTEQVNHPELTCTVWHKEPLCLVV
ncbi:MAG TPA: LysR family transcriptional regulator, partial [Halomonas sp.]|nr:LysR family transcriptional regulator [Halomonas sp.]